MNTIETSVGPPNRLLGDTLSWVFAAVVSASCLMMGTGLPHSIAVFSDLFKGLGVELPFLTRFLLATYRWLCPAFFIGIAVVLIARQFFVTDAKKRLIETAVAFVVSSCSVTLIIVALYLPLFELIRKLKAAG